MAGRILPDHPVGKCCRGRLGSVRVMSSLIPVDGGSKGKAHYKGLMTCGSVWACPVCASKVSERRRVELAAALQAWQSRGGKVYMLTLTFPHSVGESLNGLMSRLAEARRLLRNRKIYKGFVAVHGVQGTIRALEVTYGVNGWHVHTHEILLCTGFLRPEASELAEAWRKACVDVGLREPNGHGVSIDGAEKAAQYIGKWGLEAELTKSAQKKAGNGGSYTPFDFLRVVAGTTDGSRHIDDDPERAVALYREYIGAIKGRKQLHWDKGIREMLGMEDDMTDEEVAAADETAAVEMGVIPADDWRLVCRFEARGALLDAAERDGWPGVQALIADLRRQTLRLCN